MPGRPKKNRIKVAHEEKKGKAHDKGKASQANELGPPQKQGLSRKGRVMKCKF